MTPPGRFFALAALLCGERSRALLQPQVGSPGDPAIAEVEAGLAPVQLAAAGRLRILTSSWKSWGETEGSGELKGAAAEAVETAGSEQTQDSTLVDSGTQEDEQQQVEEALLEGKAEPFNETERGEVPDAWASVPDAHVTFSYATHCDIANGCRSSGFHRGQPSLQEAHRNVMASIRLLRFCFSDVLIVLDTPHVGHNKVGPEVEGDVGSHMVTPDGPAAALLDASGGAQAKFLSTWAELQATAVSTGKAAAEMLRDHCPGHAPTWKVKVLDYSTSAMVELARTHYAIPEDSPNQSIFDRMYVNTMVLDQNFETKGQYVFHVDAQWRLYRSAWSPATPNFIKKAISLMRSDSRVYLASLVNTFNMEPDLSPYNKFGAIPGSVHGSSPAERVRGMLQGWSPQSWSSDMRPLHGEAFHGRWDEAEEEEAKKIALFLMMWKEWGGIVTRHQFLMDVDRFRGLFPLSEWDTAAEHMWAANMNDKRPDEAFQVYFNETVGLFAGPSEH